MYGAILGDIIGSPFEFDRGDKTKDFELFSWGCRFTDDSVMTIAVAEALMETGINADEETIENAVQNQMRKWGRRYPRAGYGGRFRQWLMADHPEPYGSYGNGSAMRVSAAGWLYPDLEQTRAVARATAKVTHNHPEGIKGAEATASCIFLARNGKSKEEIREYVTGEFHYNLNRTLDEIRPFYHHVESCQETVPEAIIAFLEAGDFEDTVRNAVSIGGDTDTLAAIAGSIAEAFYGVSEELREECRKRIPGNMRKVLNQFEREIDRDCEREETTEIVFILDRSGSMAGLERDTVGGFNSMIEKQKKEKGSVLVSTVLFDNTAEVLHDRVDLEKIRLLTEKEYFVGGCTALLDAVGGAIHHIGNVHKYARMEDVPERTLFVIITDGEENASRYYSAKKVKGMIERQKSRYGWEFLFLGANIDAVQTAGRFGISEDRAVNYNCDSRGTMLNYQVIGEAISVFRNDARIDESWKRQIDEDYKKRRSDWE